MKPLFTIHAGEYLVGAHLERAFKRLNTWIPLRDTGIDLLVSDAANRKTLSLHVKFSKDFLVTHMGPEFQESLRASGWWSLDRQKLMASPADLWVFVRHGFASGSIDFVVIPRRNLIRALDAIHGRSRRVLLYLSVTQRGACWATRGLSKADRLRIGAGEYKHKERDDSLVEQLGTGGSTGAPVARPARARRLTMVGADGRFR